MSHFRKLVLMFLFPRGGVRPPQIMLAGILAGSLFSSTSGQAPLSNIEPATVFKDLRYSDADGGAGLCDVRLPEGEPPERGFPTVVVVHGGAWMSGSKWTISSYAQRLAGKGYASVTINYRLAPEHPFPAQVDDVRQALIWIAENADRFSLDLDRLALFGYSAGGHLSLLVGLLQDEPLEKKLVASEWLGDDPRWEQLPKVRAISAGGPPCDFRDLPPDNTALAYFLGGSRSERPKVYEAASPASHVSADDPPVQIIHGQTDSLVPVQASVTMIEAMRRCGVSCRLHQLDGLGHMLAFLSPKTMEHLLAFLLETLGES